MSIGIGIDLSGYSTGKSAVAAAKAAHGSVHLTLLSDSPFSRKIHSSDPRIPIETREGDCLTRLLRLGNVVVDVPIDLQGLPGVPASDLVWGITLRPIDKAVRGLPPLADKIGAIVGRFQGALRSSNAQPLLGTRLFETYPAATFRMINIATRGYKAKGAGEVRDLVSAGLGLGTRGLNDDQIDAVVCALTAIAPADCLLDGESLKRKLLLERGHKLPTGYRLLSKIPPGKYYVEFEDFNIWLKRHEMEIA